jgi:phage/plasmid-like protein (TIGR03299 family)
MHEIRQFDHMISAEVTPWHGLGIVTSQALSLSEALYTAKLDWTVSKHPAYTRDRDLNYQDALTALFTAHAENPGATLGQLLVDIGFDLPIEDTFATVRDDIRYPFGAVGTVYQPFQNFESFALLESLIDEDLKVETAGSLKNGRVVWVLVRMPESVTVNGDQHVPYLLLTTTHDGSGRVRIIPTFVRVVCNNTLRMALANVQTQWTASHTESIAARVSEARETLDLAYAYCDAFETEIAKLMEIEVPELAFEEILLKEFPHNTEASKRTQTNSKTKRETVRKIYFDSPEVAGFKGTGWGVVQAFNTADLWTGTVHGGDDMRMERQANRIIAGETMTNTDRIRGLLLPA